MVNLSVFMYVFGLFIHIDLFMALFFFLFFLLTVSLVNLRLAKERNVWTEREQKMNASTAV